MWNDEAGSSNDGISAPCKSFIQPLHHLFEEMLANLQLLDPRDDQILPPVNSVEQSSLVDGYQPDIESAGVSSPRAMPRCQYQPQPSQRYYDSDYDTPYQEQPRAFNPPANPSVGHMHRYDYRGINDHYRFPGFNEVERHQDERLNRSPSPDHGAVIFDTARPFAPQDNGRGYRYSPSLPVEDDAYGHGYPPPSAAREEPYDNRYSARVDGDSRHNYHRGHGDYAYDYWRNYRWDDRYDGHNGRNGRSQTPRNYPYRERDQPYREPAHHAPYTHPYDRKRSHEELEAFHYHHGAPVGMQNERDWQSSTHASQSPHTTELPRGPLIPPAKSTPRTAHAARDYTPRRTPAASRNKQLVPQDGTPLPLEYLRPKTTTSRRGSWKKPEYLRRKKAKATSASAKAESSSPSVIEVLDSSQDEGTVEKAKDKNGGTEMAQKSAEAAASPAKDKEVVIVENDNIAFALI